jgi:phasin family protein
MTLKTKAGGNGVEPSAVSAPERAAGSGFGTLSSGAEAAAASFEQAQTQVKEGVEKVTKVAEQLVSFGQGNLEAVVKSGQIWATGWQDLSKQFASQAQSNLDEGLSVIRALAGVKSLKEAIDLHTNFARTAFEKALAESGRFTESSIKLAEQASAPLTARVTAAVEAFSRPAA